MELLITALSAISVLFGIGLFFGGGLGNLLAGATALGAGMYAYDTKSIIPIFVGFAILWIFRLIGLEK